MDIAEFFGLKRDDPEAHPQVIKEDILHRCSPSPNHVDLYEKILTENYS
jgi:hypothetical protein